MLNNVYIEILKKKDKDKESKVEKKMFKQKLYLLYFYTPTMLNISIYVCSHDIKINILYFY